MRVAIDARKLHDFGIGTYIRNLLRHLLERPGAHALPFSVGETISLYSHGRFTDLCRGPHVQRLSQIGAELLFEDSYLFLFFASAVATAAIESSKSEGRMPRMIFLPSFRPISAVRMYARSL